MPADTTSPPVAAAGQGCGAASATRAFGVQAKPAQLRYQPIAVIALDFDAAVLYCAARPAQPLQPRGQLIELGRIPCQSADHCDRLPAATGHFPADTHV